MEKDDGPQKSKESSPLIDRSKFMSSAFATQGSNKTTARASPL